MMACCSFQIYFKVVSLVMAVSFVSGDCIDWDLGMENGMIPDERITSNSGLKGYGSQFGRLNDKRGSWCMWEPVEEHVQLYLQIDLQSLHIICAVSTQGGYPDGTPLWVKEYTLQSSIDNKKWTNYTENGQVKIFLGNNDANTANKNVLSNVLITRWLRFVVNDLKADQEACMRTEVYGVKQKPENIVAGNSTTQSSIYSDDYSNGTSDKAVDGNPNQEFKHGHCSRTLEDDPSWWRVDLSHPVQVFEVRIVIGNSPLSDGSNVTRNQVYNITMGDSLNVTYNPVCARWDGSFELEASLVCHMNPPRSGRYVGILTTRKQFLQLCEVEIFAKGNLAFRKPASGPGNFPAENVVDGNLETRSWDGFRWKIDLGRKVPVKEVYYYTDPHHPYLVVRVASSSRPTEVGQECRHRAPINILHYQGIGRFHFVCWPMVLGRYVILRNTHEYGFSLLEVEVYSTQRGCQIQPICWFINDGRSSDDLYSASSSRVGYGPEDCRGAWLPSTKSNVHDFLQINLGYEFYICAIATQGKPTADQWITKYMIHSSLDNITWMTYKENGIEKVFHGNTGLNDTVKHNLEEVITASFLRFQPTDFFGQKTLRVELYGALKSPVPVKTPILVNVTAQSSTSVAAFWELPKWYTSDKDILSFKLLYRSLASDTKNVTTALTIEKNFSTVVTGLKKFTEYEFKVCVVSSVGCGPKSSPKIARTLEDVPSKAPTNFTVTANTSTAIIASWQLPSPESRHGIIIGFKIFFRKEGSNINRLENISVSNVTMYAKDVTALAKFTRYEFCVLAFNSAGDGINSSVRFARTKEDIPSKAPSKFVVTANTSTSVTASWQLPPTGSRNGIIKGFKLLINRKGSEDKPNVRVVNASNAAVYTKTVTGLQESTEYELQVLAYTSPGDGPKSSAQFVTTKGSGKKHIASTGKKHWILIVFTVVSFILALMLALFCYLVWRHRRRKRKMAFFAQKYRTHEEIYFSIKRLEDTRKIRDLLCRS